MADGRVALVTGAAAGIGAATARALARFGCDVAICDDDLEGLAATARDLEAIGCQHHAEVLDVQDAEATISWITGAAAVLGPIDIVVSDAGGGFVVATAALGHVPEAGGSIINITSVEGSLVLTGPLALELAERRIRVNYVVSTGGPAEDVAAAVVWLASPMARFVTGTTVHVDGGPSSGAGWHRRISGGYRL